MQLKYPNPLVFLLIEVTLLPGLLKNRSEASIHPLTSVVQFLPSGPCSHYQRHFNRTSSVQVWGERRTLSSLHTEATWNLWEASCGHSWHVTSMGFCLQLSPAPLCWQYQLGNTAENVTLSKLSWLIPQHLSLGWRRERLRAGCFTLFLLPLVYRGEGEHEAGSAVKNWRGLQHLPHGWKQKPQASKKWGVQDGTGEHEATQLSKEQSIVWNKSQEGTHFPGWFSEFSHPTWGWGHLSKPSSSAVWWLSTWQISDHTTGKPMLKDASRFPATLTPNVL